MKKYFIIGNLLLLAACNPNPQSSSMKHVFEHSGITDAKSPEQKMMDEAAIVCRDHVEYLSFPATHGYRTYLVHVQVNGQPFTC